jgi:hypothetical protein
LTRLILTVIVGLALGSSARAQEPLDAQEPLPAEAPRHYLILGGGVFAPAHTDMDGYDAGPSFQLGIGQRLKPSLAVEGTAVLGVTQGSFRAYDVAANATAWVLPVSLVAKFIAPAGAAEFYAVGGPSLYAGRFEAAASTSYSSARNTETGVGVGFQGGVGIAMRVSPSAALAVDARYYLGSIEINEYDLRVDSIQVAATLAFDISRRAQ